MNYHSERKTKQKNSPLYFFLGIILLGGLFLGFVSNAQAATQWVNNPSSCNISDPTNFPGQNCSPERICGDNTGIAQCYNTTTLLAPAVSATSNTLWSALYPNGGYVVNCYSAADAAAPFCDNSGSYWCNRSTTCYTTQLRDTICTANAWGASTCGACRSGYGDCNADGDVCEVQFNTTNYPSGTNNHYGTTCLVTDVRCDSGYYDCDASGVAAGNGCEALRTGACTTGGGLTGTWACAIDAGGSCTNGASNYTCTCIPPKQYFETGTKSQYGTSDPLLWGVQFGIGPLITFGNSTDEDLFVVNNDGSVGLAQITAPGVTTDKLYNVAGSLYWNGVMIGAGASGDGWGLTGNAGTDPLTNFIGTTDIQPLVFKTDSTERLRIGATGVVGVGLNASGTTFVVRSTGGYNTHFSMTDSSRDGLWIGNGTVYSVDEAGLYDVGGDVPLAVYDATTDLIHYTNNFTVSSISARAAIGTNGIEESAVLLLEGNGGFLMPRMTTLMRDSIGSPATGLQIYNTQTQQFEYYNGVEWAPVSDSANTLYTADGSISANRNVTITDGVELRFIDEHNANNYLYLKTDYSSSGNLRFGGNNDSQGASGYIEFGDSLYIVGNSVPVEIQGPQITLLGNNSNLTIGEGNTFTDYRDAGFRYGLRYAFDYSSDFTARSLVDKAYVDSVLGGGSAVTEVLLTSTITDGSFSSSGYVGYEAANDMCENEYPGSYFCRTDEIIQFIRINGSTGFTGLTAWIAEGPPGFTSNSNDCNGWTDNLDTKLGAFWQFTNPGGGMGWLTTCAVTKQLACCQ